MTMKKGWAAPVAPGVIDLGTVCVENRAALPRLVMQHVTIPLKETDGFRLSDPVSVYDTGTGQPERAQVERWALPWPNGNERVVRIQYPAVLPPSNTRIIHTVRKDTVGASPGYALRPNVVDAWNALRIVFFCGPKSTHFVEVDIRGPSLTIAQGPNYVIRRYDARVYEPPHAPTLRTHWGVQIDIKTSRDVDHIECWARAYSCDPRVDIISEDRALLADADREVGFYIYAVNQTACEPLPLYPEQTQRRRDWNPTERRWEWVWEAKAVGTAGQDCNRRISWGLQMSARFFLVCQGTGSLDAGGIRDQTCDSMRLHRLGTPAISEEWVNKPEAFGPQGTLPRIPKQHEHYENPGRNFDYVRGRLEQEAMNVYGSFSPAEHARTQRFGGQANFVWGPYASTGGDNQSFSQFLTSPALLWRIPGFAHAWERAYQTLNVQHFYREIDGTIVRPELHPLLYYQIGAPGATLSRDLLGHSQGVNYEFSGHAIVDERNNDNYTCPKGTHYELVGLPQVATLFGDQGVAEVAFHMCQHKMGCWPRIPERHGATGADRSAGRLMSDMSWHLWSSGHRDPFIMTFCQTHIWDWYIGRAHELVEAQYPGRVIRTIYQDNAQGTGGLAPNATGSNLPYWNPWMSALHIKGARGLARMLRGYANAYADLFTQHAEWYCDDMARGGFPMKVDEATAAITYMLPGTNGPYQVIWAAAYYGGRLLTTQELEDNSFFRVASGHCVAPTYPCSHEGSVHVDSFAASWFKLAVADIMQGLGSHAIWRQRAFIPIHAPKFEREPPNNIFYAHLIWIEKTFGKSAIGSLPQDWLTLRLRTARGATAINNATGVAASRLNPGSCWVTRDNGGAEITRVQTSNGATLQTVSVDVAPQHQWSDCCPLLWNGANYLALLDGINQGGRTTFRVVVVLEAAPTVAVLALNFALSTATAASLIGLAWDARKGAFILLASDRTAWVLPQTGTVATRYLGIAVDVPNPTSIDIDRDTKLLAVADASGVVWLYTRGVEWGCPQVSYQGAPQVTFSEHARTHDLQRIITFGPQFVEAEI